MSHEEVMEIQQGIWIEERLIQEAELGPHLQVEVQPGEIRISGPSSETEEKKTEEDGWDVFRSLGNNAQPGLLTNAAKDHDRYLYGKGQ